MGKKGRKARRVEAAAHAAGAATSEAASSTAQTFTPTPVTEREPEPPLSRISTAFIALFLLYQIAMPLRYYLGGRGDDERFSWRMFSTVRLRKCDAQVREVVGSETKRVDLGKAVQIAWIGMLERDRPQVVDKLLERRCQLEGVREVRYEQSCTNTDGSAAPRHTRRLDCAHHAFSDQAAP